MKILAATGGANHSDTAVILATTLATHTNSTLALLTVIAHESARPTGEAILSRAVTLIKETAVSPQTHIRIGQVAQEIITEASEGAYDLVVVGERHEHNWITRLLGPTADRVIAHMPCSVLIARQSDSPLKRLLLCEGGREPSLLSRVVQQLTPLLTASEALTVLHIMSQMTAAPGIPGWELQADADELIAHHAREGEILERDSRTVERLPIHLHTKIRHGLVVEEILDEASSGHYDLIIIGAHEGSGWERFLLDDLAHQIVTKSNTSILIVS